MPKQVNQLKALRLKLKWSQFKVAQVAGVSLGTYQAAESGEQIKASTYEKITKALGKPMTLVMAPAKVGKQPKCPACEGDGWLLLGPCEDEATVCETCRGTGLK